VLLVATFKGAVRVSMAAGEIWNDATLPATKLTNFQHLRTFVGPQMGGMVLLVGSGGILGAPLMMGAM
jgi:hypothetical protein